MIIPTHRYAYVIGKHLANYLRLLDNEHVNQLLGRNIDHATSVFATPAWAKWLGDSIENMIILNDAAPEPCPRCGGNRTLLKKNGHFRVCTKCGGSGIDLELIEQAHRAVERLRARPLF